MLKKWWPSMLTFAVVIYCTLIPHPVGADELALFPGYDKLIHAIIMGGLLGAILFDEYRSTRILKKQYIINAGVGVAIFAVADEILQHVIAPERTFDLWDIFAGFAGVIIAAFAAPPVIKRLFRKKRAAQNP